MSPKQAIELLDTMVSQMRLSRMEHHNAVLAVQVLAGLVPQPTPQKTELKAVEQTT